MAGTSQVDDFVPCAVRAVRNKFVSFRASTRVYLVQLPATSYQLPATSYQLPAAGPRRTYPDKQRDRERHSTRTRAPEDGIS
ncbi:hypothetical protein E4U53_005378 [Claviceps sorghi]|nr:hypothetical protein E4U53_005378 [Claviceps sorghi]